MTTYPVTMPRRIVAGLRRHAAAAAPAECCGALIGQRTDGSFDVRCLMPLENAAADPRRYEIDAGTVLRVERHAVAAGLQVLGFYHSHPEGAARPSALDLELASPGYIYAIVQAGTGGVRVWRLRDDRSGFAELALHLLAGAA